MSDNATTGEGEEVLALVRRLVTDDTGERLVAAAAANGGVLRPVSVQDRLVLTAALRVVEPKVPPATPASGIRTIHPVRADVTGHPVFHADRTAPGQSSPDRDPPRFGRGEPVAPLRGDGPVFRSQQAAAAGAEPAFRHAAGARAPGAAAAPSRPGAADTAGTRPGPAADTPRHATPRMTAERAMPDETALRRIVADVIHQELNGALGERITRNLRKLVRREIARVLAENGDI